MFPAVDYANSFMALYHNANLRARYNCGAERGAPREAREKDEVAAQTGPASGLAVAHLSPQVGWTDLSPGIRDVWSHPPVFSRAE